MSKIETQPFPPPSKAMFWTGWVITLLPVAMLTMSAVMKFLQPPEAVKGFAVLGYGIELAIPLAIVEIACTLIYLFPNTAVLGAILLTGYLGGATATHVRVYDPFYMPIILGVLVWLGIYLRDARLRALVPWRS